MKSLWEILVPTIHRVSQRPIRVRYHRVWDAAVRRICGGLTIAAPVKGEWLASDGELFRDRMIPVRIVATREEIDVVVNMTLEYYDELAVLCYKLSDEVILKHQEQTS